MVIILNEFIFIINIIEGNWIKWIFEKVLIYENWFILIFMIV